MKSSNIRNSNNSTLFSFKFDYGSYNNVSLGITITENNYISINSLLYAINSAISSALVSYSGLSIVLSVVNTYYIQIDHNCITLILTKCILINYILGFNNNLNTTSPIISTNFYCLNIDNYLTMYITNLSGADSTNVNGRLLSFKIPLNTVNGNILYYGECLVSMLTVL